MESRKWAKMTSILLDIKKNLLSQEEKDVIENIMKKNLRELKYD